MDALARMQRWAHILWIFPLAWGVTIYYLLTMPVDVEPQPWMFPHIDKLVHMVLFGTLAWLILLPLRLSLRRSVLLSVLLSFSLATLYGGWMEYWQSTLPHREGNWADVLANALGAASVLFALRKTTKTTLTAPS